MRLRRDAGVRGARPNKLFTLTRRGAHSPATPPHPPPPSAGVSSQLAEVVKSAQAQANQGKKLLDAIKKEGEEEMRRDKKSARIQAYTAQYTRLCKVYVDAMKEHQRAKEALRKTQVDGVVRQGMSLPQNENKSEAEVRREVERLVARSAARRATPEERERFGQMAREFEKSARSNDEVAFMRIDREFNDLTVVAAHNEFAAGAMDLVHSLSRRFWYIHYKQAADMPRAAKLHADVARGIAAQDEEAAAKEAATSDVAAELAVPVVALLALGSRSGASRGESVAASHRTISTTRASEQSMRT